MSSIQTIGLMTAVLGALLFVGSGAVPALRFSTARREPNVRLMLGGAILALAGALLGWVLG